MGREDQTTESKRITLKHMKNRKVCAICHVHVQIEDRCQGVGHHQEAFKREAVFRRLVYPFNELAHGIARPFMLFMVDSLLIVLAHGIARGFNDQSLRARDRVHGLPGVLFLGLQAKQGLMPTYSGSSFPSFPSWSMAVRSNVVCDDSESSATNSNLSGGFSK
jgi:hypothetical protein